MLYQDFILMKKSCLACLLAVANAAQVIDAKPAAAILNYHIYESLNSLVVETSGSLNLPEPIGSEQTHCTAAGVLAPHAAVICTGPGSIFPRYRISGPSRFGDPLNNEQLWRASSVKGVPTILDGNHPLDQAFSIVSYISGNPIISSATFKGKTLEDVGLSKFSGTIGTWVLVSTGDQINVVVGHPVSGPPSVPGPLPLIGASTALLISRRLRQRINTLKKRSRS
jgi:hypothetical protein